MAKTITLKARELADAYALRTLYDYLSGEGFDELRFGHRSGEYIKGAEERICEIFDGVQKEGSSLYDVVVSCASDLEDCYTERPHVAVDIAILKNCVQRMAEKERVALKSEYSIDDSKPVVVVGRDDDPDGISTLVRQLNNDANIYVVGEFLYGELGSDIRERENVHVIKTYGVLKDYYAVADVALDSNYLDKCWDCLHNFVEMTEGGPLFMVSPACTEQYGYKQLVRSGVIVKCRGFDSLLKKVESFVRDFSGNEEHRKKRARHILRTRRKYLPFIRDVIRACQQLGEEDEPREKVGPLICEKRYARVMKDLDITSDNKKGVRIMHKDSYWGYEEL